MLSNVLLGEEHCRDWDGAQHSPFFLLRFLKKINSNNRPLANPVRSKHTTSNLQIRQWSHSPWGFPSLDFPPNEQKTLVPDVSASLVSSSPKKPLLVLSTLYSRPSSPTTTTRGHSLHHFVQPMTWSLAFATGLIQNCEVSKQVSLCLLHQYQFMKEKKKVRTVHYLWEESAYEYFVRWFKTGAELDPGIWEPAVEDYLFFPLVFLSSRSTSTRKTWAF